MYKHILVPIDGSAESMRGVAEAVKLARSLGAELRLFHVVNEPALISVDMTGVSFETLSQVLREHGQQIVAAAEKVVREQGVEPHSVIVEAVGARAADLIVGTAGQWPADLIVMGTHGRHGLQRLALGSDAQLVLRYSPVPVLLVRGNS